MKGLILRDFYSLQNSLKLFLGVTAGVIVLSVLFILSSKYGNIALGIAEMEQEDLGEEMFYSMFQIAIWVVLLLPLAFMTMGVECFKADKQAGFSKVLFSMPVSAVEIVFSRYLSCFALSLISLTGSLIAGFFISLVSDFFSWTQLLGSIISIFSILFIYSSILLVFLYNMGVEKSDVIMIISTIIIILCIIGFCIKGGSVPEGQYENVMIEKINFLRDIMTRYCIWLLGAALFAGGCSFRISCKIVKKKGGEKV